MGTKRAHSEVDSSDGQSMTTTTTTTAAPAKRNKPKTKPLKRKEESISWVKKRARDIERLLKRDHETLPADKQNDLERELAAHRARIEDEAIRKLRSRMIAKYHMVRFFERKKAMRLEKQTRDRLEKATDPAEIRALEADLHVAQVDVAYARYFPFMEPYVSMYTAAVEERRKKADEPPSFAQAALRCGRPPMWGEVERALEEGQAALERLRDRVPPPRARRRAGSS